jgi:Tfp pilus assembly protein PilE
MVVVVIIGILAAIAIPRFTSVVDGVKQAEAGPILKQLCTLAEAEYLRDNTWPPDVDRIPGWSDPSAQHYSDWTFSDGVASATASEAGLQNQSMNCTTKVITPNG